ncbi:MAG: hypothetical protein J6T16_04675 [Opitutales bacterium]|nr:hypothetical protein [Opitutales bacterium]
MVRAIIKGDEFIHLNQIEHLRWENRTLSKEWFESHKVDSQKIYGCFNAPDWYYDIDLKIRCQNDGEEFYEVEDYNNYDSSENDKIIAKEFKYLAEKIIKDPNYIIEIINSENPTSEEIHQLNIEKEMVY